MKYRLTKQKGIGQWAGQDLVAGEGSLLDIGHIPGGEGIVNGGLSFTGIMTDKIEIRLLIGDGSIEIQNVHMRI